MLRSKVNEDIFAKWAFVKSVKPHQERPLISSLTIMVENFPRSEADCMPMEVPK